MTTGGNEVRDAQMPGLIAQGKVRDLYDLDGELMIVATDRISAFDVVMREPIPEKGVILTAITRHWLEMLPACTPHHLRYVVQRGRAPAGYAAFESQLAGRAMVCRKAFVLPIECVARGFLVGGGWKEYCERASVSGIPLPTGLKCAQRLDQPIFTPSTKAKSGHDESISFEQALAIAEKFAMSRGLSESAGREWIEEARRRTLEIYAQARDFAAQRGILIADTKFEFGVCGDDLLLVDEVLTPDSSRFWPADQYRVGSNPPSFDKQYLRDYLDRLPWNKQPPPPPLPEHVIRQTRARYVEAYERITGRRQF